MVKTEACLQNWYLGWGCCVYIIQADRTVCMEGRGSTVPSIVEVRTFLWRSCLAVGELGKFKDVLTCRGSSFDPESRTP